jgi:hypothetical protein
LAKTLDHLNLAFRYKFVVLPGPQIYTTHSLHLLDTATPQKNNLIKISHASFSHLHRPQSCYNGHRFCQPWHQRQRRFRCLVSRPLSVRLRLCRRQRHKSMWKEIHDQRPYLLRELILRELDAAMTARNANEFIVVGLRRR